MTKSYMELCFHLEGSENVYCRVPTVWDDIEKKWRGYIKTPINQKLIHGEGKDSISLEHSFNKSMHEALSNPETCDDAFSLFKPKSYWDNGGKMYGE